MTNSADLDRLRWSWSAEAAAWLRARLRGVDEALEQSDLAHVMVLGDSQVGKTTLLLRLFGVTDPEAATEAAVPLRAGRGRGRSATPVPIRYQWSGDPDHWSLAYDDPGDESGAHRGTAWLTSGQLEKRLRSFRTGATGDRLRWESRARPLEIGLPGRFAGPERRTDLRVFDLPGLHSAGAEEQEAAKALLAVYAPVVDHVVFVVSADQFAEMVRDPAITENPFLLGWGEQAHRFSLVFTRAFSGDSVRRHLQAVLGEPGSPCWTRDRIVAAVQEHYADQLLVSELPSVAPSGLFPVEIGESWKELLDSDPDYAEAVAPVCDDLLRRLTDTVARYSDPDRRHLAASEIAARVEIVVRDNVRRREQALNAAAQAWRRAKRAHTQALAFVHRAREAAKAARQRTEALRKRLERLAEWPVVYVRPDAPEMKGNLVRAKQEEERAAWTEAARRAWTDWRETTEEPEVPRQPPHDLSTRIREKYDELCRCCHLCERWKRFVGDTPDHCYGRMTGVGTRMPAWIRTTLREHADSATARLAKAEADTERQCAVASRYADHTAEALARAVAELDDLLEQATEEQVEDAANLTVARSVRAVHSQRNETYVHRLLGRAAQSDGDERSWLVLAALRGIHDLNRMFP
ncbi:hypothetical protein GCM10011579_098010 [Streptomyces albiflavescens]|uniref:Uncharacterized protein n=1 Tax=Streptomyces albiflavescens TaxID=1623582 RepID=A0A917YFS2_9ACTN|nr:GTPase [Streptomyces albiflavescens]GGN96490.1 hypothetical protein GCM10011579_098010 [Streptomyces albiflavescens]